MANEMIELIQARIAILEESVKDEEAHIQFLQQTFTDVQAQYQTDFMELYGLRAALALTEGAGHDVPA